VCLTVFGTGVAPAIGVEPSFLVRFGYGNRWDSYWARPQNDQAGQFQNLTYLRFYLQGLSAGFRNPLYTIENIGRGGAI
jgi:hypothetical protein